MEPLESTSIHLVQSGIARLLDYFPGAGIEPAARDQFNRLSVFEWESIRDFLVLHYRANARVGDPFWDACRAMPIPDTLAERIALFEATGRIHREHEELFTEEAWAQVMIGQGRGAARLASACRPAARRRPRRHSSRRCATGIGARARPCRRTTNILAG